MTRANGAALEYLNYTYDADGRRIGKERETIVTVGGEAISNSSTTKYIYLGDTLTEMQIVNVDESVDTFRFTYDATGPMSMTFYGTEYFYLKNAQGDVTGIVNAAGTQVVAYTYDAWGKLLSTTGTMAGSIGTLNPFRYRGYFYDTETGLYYLNSRYYNPETGRFINADLGISEVGGELIGNNMFAYCFNNPVNMSDPTGNWPSWSTVLKAAAIAVTAVAVVAAVAVTVATFGATSIAATIVVSSAITIVAKATEVAVLQGKKSASEGKNTGQVATDIIESVFDNGVGTVTKTAVTKTAGYATGFYSQSSSFQDVMKLQKMDGYNLKTLAGAATHEIANRFTDLKYCVSAKASTGSMLISYGFAGLNVVNTVISIFADDPVQRATSRGYTLK